jgi:ATP-dependent Clp protease ATP-binding subunit ClpC
MDRHLPDKGIDLIDEAAARARINAMETPEQLKEMEKKIEEVRREKEEAVNAQEFEKAARLRDDERRLSDELEEERGKWRSRRNSYQPVVTGEDIADVVAEWTGIPVVQLTGEESERLLHMEQEIEKRLIGQSEAVVSIAKAIRRARSGLKDPRRPIGSFLLLGPTGVGKTELARCLSSFLFGSDESMIRLDMSEFMEKHEVSKLIGAPPGYVGYEEGGKLTEAVRRRPYSVVLFDEIEKAHPDIFNILLQIFDDGHLTDGQGKTVDFRNTVILMTSNVGARESAKGSSLGFSDGDEKDPFNWGNMKTVILDEAGRTFRPEFINRLDEMIVFRPLTRQNMTAIVGIMLEEVRTRLAGRGISFSAGEDVTSFLLDRGYQPRFGARPLRRAIQTYIEDRLADFLLEKRSGSSDKIEAYITDGNVAFKMISGGVPGVAEAVNHQ